jgi:hypothetical protein
MKGTSNADAVTGASPLCFTKNSNTHFSVFLAE